MLYVNINQSKNVLGTDRKINPVSQKRLWIGMIMSGMAILFLLFDSVTKLMETPQTIEGTVSLGYPVELVPEIGLILLILTIIYVIPQTSIFGAILLTGYLGGAVASNFRLMNPLFSHTLFPVYMAVLIWGGLYLRDNLISRFFPFRNKA